MLEQALRRVVGPVVIGLLLAIGIGRAAVDQRTLFAVIAILITCGFVYARLKLGWTVWMISLYVLVGAVPRRYTDVALSLGPLTFVDLAIAALILILVIENFRFQKFADWVPVLVVIALALLRVLMTGSYLADELTGLFKFAGPLAVGLQVQVALKHKGGIKRLVAALCLGGVVTCALGIWAYAQGDILMTLGSVDIKHQDVGIIRTVSPLGNTNTLGAMMALLIPLPLSLFVFQRQGVRRSFYLGAAILFVVVLVLSGSRAALIGGMSGLIALAIVTRRLITAKHWAMGIGFVLGGALLLFAVQGRFLRAETLLTEGVSGVFQTSGRKDAWAEGIQLFWAQPFIGWGPLYITQLFHAHNLFIELWAENGALVGTYLIVLLSWRVFRPSLCPNVYYDGARAGLVAFLVAGMGDYLLWEPRAGVFVWSIVSILEASSVHVGFSDQDLNGGKQSGNEGLAFHQFTHRPPTI